MSKPTCIIVDGPYVTQNRHGDEWGRYSVFKGDDEGEPTGKADYFQSYEAAVKRGQELAAVNPGLELVIDASRH